ncbi:hypothetical protein HA466_0276780 [Hirschfeldia incana]|nr:hypothetical protein HA466_0276780 [Hirschfeldia incana]
MDDSPEVDDEDVCRICQSPEEPGNPLRYPCLCRGSIKFVHQDCLHTWLHRGGNNKCEVCGRSYSFVPVYSENAPERLPCDEFLIGVLLRAGRYLKLILLWIAVILFNTFCISLHPLGQAFVADFQGVLMSRKLALLWASLLYSTCVACSILFVSFVRIDVGDIQVGGLPGWFLPDGGGVAAGVLHFLRKYMKILCDWYLLKLMHFLGQHHRVILVPPVTLLDEFGVIRRLLFFVDDHVFAGLAISVHFSTLFVLLPFSIGWVVLATVGGSYLSGNYSPVILGYMMMLSFSFAYVGIHFTLPQNPFPVLVRWFSLGFHFVTVALPCHLLAFLVKDWKNILLIKDASVLFLKIGALPWIVGWFLQICISPMFGTAVFQRFEIMSHKPCIIMGIRWISGFYCLIITNDFMEHIQRIMHKRAFWYLVDVTDPDYKITKLNLPHIFFVLASHWLLLVILFRLPVKAITLVSPSVFPLELWINYESPFIGDVCGIYLNLMHAGPRWLVGLTKPIRLMLHKWIITVSSWLQLSGFLLAVPRGEPVHHAHGNPWFLWLSLAEGSMVTFYKSQSDEDDFKEPRHKRYRTRIAIMLMLAALSLFLVSTIFMALPIMVGRVFSYSISFILRRVGIKHDDICAFWIGCYILRVIYISICFAFDHILTGRTDFLLKDILIRTRNCLLFSIWIFIIPGLLGLLIDLMIIIPLRVPLDESPLYFSIQDWLIGLVVLHLWIFLTMLTPVKCFATKAWRRKFERIKNVGIYRLPSMWLLREVIGPIINSLLTTLSIPYVLVKSLLPLLGYSQSFNAATERFIWPASLALIAVLFMTKLTFELIIYLHELMFNEREYTHRVTTTTTRKRGERKSFPFPKMEVSPSKASSYDESFSQEEEDEDEDLCRICRSPEEPENPLRYPCLCRGSIKYVHEDCLRTWLDRRRNNKCEVCGRTYSFIPVYSENAPERLPCDEFLLGVLSRLGRYLKSIVPWIVVILFNAFCNSLHPLGQEVVSDFQGVLMSQKLALLWAGLLYSGFIVCFMLSISCARMEVGDLRFERPPGGFLADNVIVNGVLCKYMKILCDWYLHKLVHFLGPPPRLRFLPPEAPLHEFGVIRRLLCFLDDDAFAVLAISVFVSTLFVLLPFSIGWVVLATVGGSYLSGNYSPVILGYMMMLSISFVYFGIHFTLPQNPFPVLVRWFSLGFHFITVTLPCHLLVFVVKAWKNILLIKDAFVLFFKIGALPCIVGWFLEVCTSPMFGTTIFQSLLSHNPCFVMCIRWLSGSCYLMIAFPCMEHIQKIIHRRAFWYLPDVTDPDYKITKLNLPHIFFVFASHGLLLVIWFRLPIKAIALVSPSFFPLELWVSEVSSFIGGVACGIYLNLMQAGLTWLMKFTSPAIELILQNWIISVSSWLQLSDFLLVDTRGEDIQHDDDNLWFLLYFLAEGSMVILYKPQNDEDDMKEQRDNGCGTRIAIMLMLAALSLFLVSTIFMALPIMVGRVFSYSISFILRRVGIKHDDICAFWIGCYILRAIYILLKYILIRIRNGLLFSIWIFIIPGLLGLLIDLMIIIPLRVPLDESPLYFSIQDWLIGLVVLHLWIFLTMLTPVKCFATTAWRRKFERIKNVGINRLPSMWLLRDVIGPIINSLLTTLSIPYVFVKSLLPLLGYSQSFNAATERYIWPASLALIAVWFMTKLTLDAIIYLHELMFNERYMVGERVGDLTEEL